MSNSNSCDKVTEILPWFVNQTLPADEMLSVRGHLKDCPACTAEAKWLARVESSLEANPGDAESTVAESAKGTNGFEQLRLRIAHERKRSDRRRMLVAASALLAVATLTGSLLTSYLLEPKFRTASDVQGPAGIQADQFTTVEVRFTEGASLDSLRSIMQSSGAVLVEGPDSEGRVVLELPIETGRSHEQVLQELRADPDVLTVTALQITSSEE